MSKLLDFLTENPVNDLEETSVISERLKNFPFTYRVVSNDEFTQYQKDANRPTGKGRNRTLEYNSKLFNELVVLNHTMEPNFKDAAAIKKAQCNTPTQLLNRSLLAGEVAELSQRILTLSGFEQEIDDLVDEAKNSSEPETEKQNTPISGS
ncbi:MAG: phage tail assembly chaperone [Oscillospiraceae bacterium]